MAEYIRQDHHLPHGSLEPHITNGDCIRQMSDEALAEWLVSIIECDDGCPCIKECGEKEEMGFCYPSMLEWLKEEVEDGGTD